MSKTSRLGHIGESGTRDFLNLWFLQADQGIGAKIVESMGINDIGDIDGVPYTCIECKNHSHIKLGNLLDNAEWKSKNAGRPIWFLVYKRKGYGPKRAAHWGTCTTVSGFLTGVLPVVSEDGTQRPAFTVEDVEQLCSDNAVIDAEIAATYPGFPQPELKWTLRIMFRGYKSDIQNKKDEDVYSVTLDTEERIIPIVVHPRISSHPGEWYVSTRLAAYARVLETVGVLPQDPRDYVSDEEEEAS